MRLLALVLMFLPLLTPGADGERRMLRDGVSFGIAPRTPEQIRAFYAARGFPAAMVDAIASACLIGVGVHNRRGDTLWLELADWRFTDASGREVRRITRPEWDTRWQAINAPQAARSTFDWTQLPESRDLQPDEPVAGNVAVHAPAGEFSLTARFRTGSGGVVEITVPGLRCTDGEGKP